MEWLDYLREPNVASTLVRLTLVLFCGGLIGLEREHKRRPAGFRTYMLVCLGAAITTMLGQYEYLMLRTQWADVAAQVGGSVDVTRYGAQVINGVGFLGAGTIIVTGRQQVRGITTAACLWASACMGLTIGAGFYECTLVGFALIYLCMKLFPLIEDKLVSETRNLNLFVEFDDINDLGELAAKIKELNVEIFDIDVEKTAHTWSSQRPNAVLELRLPQGGQRAQLLAELSGCHGVRAMEEV